MIEWWHGISFQHPLRRLREAVDILHLVLEQNRLNYAGQVFTLPGRIKLAANPLRRRVPVYLATLSPRGLRLTGEIADGWLGAFLSPGHYPATFRTEFEAGMARRAEGYRTAEPMIEHSVELGQYLGIQPRYVDSTDIGGTSFEAYVHHAMLAVAMGRCEVALLAYASRQRSRRSRTMQTYEEAYTISGEFEAPCGLVSPIGQYALIAAGTCISMGRHRSSSPRWPLQRGVGRSSTPRRGCGTPSPSTTYSPRR